ncbi:hypothetical protein KC19_VG074700 [Ceratodon purpureus]|uniref:Uncharacterized protein n=1 Tax=Ceratodon purpureus TaxID=3225 RepID=A0A8T0HNJ6_CERPU|nr:hypothetical protein KC19_VG074700 [Ceratodon purpureus]
MPVRFWNRKKGNRDPQRLPLFCKYIGGNETEGHFRLVNEAYCMFAHTNPLHPDVFPSIPCFESEVVNMTASFLGSKLKASGGHVCGNMTSRGTESILMAVKSTRDFMKATQVNLAFASWLSGRPLNTLRYLVFTAVVFRCDVILLLAPVGLTFLWITNDIANIANITRGASLAAAIRSLTG